MSHREAGSVILKITYGYTTEARRRDPLVDLAQETMHVFADSTVPGKWLVDVVPVRELARNLSACCILTVNSALCSRLDSGYRVQGHRPPLRSHSQRMCGPTL